MMPPIITFFNNKGGVGKTSLVYHTAWKAAEMGYKVLCADLDPQANLTANFLNEEQLVELLESAPPNRTIYECIAPQKEGTGDINPPALIEIDYSLYLIPGDLRLSLFEDELSAQWPKCADRDSRAFRVITSFYRVLMEGMTQIEADLVFIDIGPNLGAINRTTLVTSDFVVMPLAPDLFSLQGLKNLGPTLRRWRDEWQERKEKNPVKDLSLPSGDMTPIGYTVMQHGERLDRPVKAYRKWIERIPEIYANAVLDEAPAVQSYVKDEHCLSVIKHYRSLVPYAQESRKPIFQLKPADGAIGGHMEIVRAAGETFRQLTQSILDRIKDARSKEP